MMPLITKLDLGSEIRMMVIEQSTREALGMRARKSAFDNDFASTVCSAVSKAFISFKRYQ